MILRGNKDVVKTINGVFESIILYEAYLLSYNQSENLQFGN